MKIVVKIGGAALDNEELVAKFCSTVATLAQAPHQIVIVHGGGAALSRTLASLNVESQFVNGLRVTDAQTRDAALMVLGGLLNKKLASRISAAGQAAIGLCGSDLQVAVAQKKPRWPELGYVGEIVSINRQWIELFWANGALPVIASLAADASGEFYNVNADEMASATASACLADALIFLTDVPGVKDAGGQVLSRLNLRQVETLRMDGTISGGMLPKLDACQRALLAGVGSVRILQASHVDVLKTMVEAPLECGTELVAHA